MDGRGGMVIAATSRIRTRHPTASSVNAVVRQPRNWGERHDDKRPVRRSADRARARTQHLGVRRQQGRLRPLAEAAGGGPENGGSDRAVVETPPPATASSRADRPASGIAANVDRPVRGRRGCGFQTRLVWVLRAPGSRNAAGVDTAPPNRVRPVGGTCRRGSPASKPSTPGPVRVEGLESALTIQPRLAEAVTI